MKKILSRLLAVIIVIGLLITAIPLNAFAEEVSSGFYRYVIKDDDSAAITLYDGWSGVGYLEEFVIPQSIDGHTVTEIRAFSIQGDGCNRLIIPATVTKIQTKAFTNFTKNEFVVEDGNKSFKSVNGVLFSADGKKLIMCPNNYNSGLYIIPEGVEEIASWAFEGCHSIDSVILPDGVKKIGSYAFYRCSSLGNVSVPESVISIGEGAFMGCNNLSEIYLGDNIESIGDYAFEGYSIKINASEGSLAYNYALENGVETNVFSKPVSIELLDYNSNIIENTNGYYSDYTDENGNMQKYYYYNAPYVPRVKITYSDGAVEYLSENEYYEKYGDYYHSISDQSGKNQWKAGEEHLFYFFMLGCITELKVNILSAPQIENLSITPVPHYAQFIEHTNGEWISGTNGDGTEYSFWRYHIYLDSFYYSFIYNGIQYDQVPYHSLGSILGDFECYFPHETTQTQFNQWQLGDNTVTIKLLNQTATATIRVVKEPEISNFSIRPTEECAQIVENTCGFWRTEYDDNGEAITYWYYHFGYEAFYYSFDYNGVTYTDVSCFDLDEIFGDYLSALKGLPNSYSERLILGDNTITISLFNQTASTTIEIVEQPKIDNLSISLSDMYKKVVEYTNGQWFTDFGPNGEERTYWEYHIYSNNLYYSFDYNGRRYTDISYYELADILGSNWVEFANGTQQSYNNQWQLGYNTITISLFGETASTTIEIVKAPEIENFSIRPDREFLYENTNGCYSNENIGPDEFVSYWRYYFSPDNLFYSFTYNGTTYTDVPRHRVYEILGTWTEFTTESQQSYYNQWQVGNNAVTVELLGKTATTYVEIKKVPQITEFSVKYVGDDLIELTNGYWYNMNDTDKFWYYYIREIDFVFSFVDENGERCKDLTYDEIYQKYNMAPVLVDSQNSLETALVLGDNYITFELFGNTAQAKVTIIKSPYIKLEIAPQKVLIVNDKVYEVYDENGIYNKYYYDVKAKLYHENGEILYFDSIFDLEHEFDTSIELFDDQSFENQWGIGKHSVTVMAMGLTATTEIEIVETHVKSIKLISDIKTEYFTHYEEVDIDGETVEIEFKDGTKIRHTIKKEPCHYSLLYGDGLDYEYYIGDYILRWRTIGDENNKWLRISYAGAYTDIPITYYNPVITDATFIKAPQGSDYINSVIRVTLEDGTTMDFTINKMYRSEGSYGWGDGTSSIWQVEGYFSTDKGLFYAWYIEKTDMQTNEILSSSLRFLGCTIDASDDMIAEFNRQQGFDYYIDAIVPNYLNIPGFNMEFNGEVTADNIDYLIYSYVDIEPAIDSEDGMKAEYIKTQLREKLNIIGDIDLTLSKLYDAEKDLYQFVYYFEYYASKSKEYMDIIELENGNYKYILEYWFEELGYYTIVVEIAADGKLVSVSNAVEKGDINADGEIDVLDLVKLKKMSLEAENIETDFADIERDGEINSLDLAIVKKTVFDKL